MSGIPRIPRKNRDDAEGTFVDISCITPLPSSQLLTHYTVKQDRHCLNNIRNSNSDPNYWHKFTVCNDSYSCSAYPRNFILKVITDFVYPNELLPVYVIQKTMKTFFLARNCLQAIIKLCRAGLTVPNPNMPDSPFKIVIIKDALTLNHIPLLNVEPNISKVLKKRYYKEILDLSRFHEDKDLLEYCPLSQQKLLLYVLSLSKQLETPRTKTLKIVLSHNEIRHLPNFESFSDWGLRSIDLSHNKIQNIENIVPLKDFPNLVAVQLDDNPLCCRFDSGLTYFLYVKSICRNLTTLDNKRLFEDGVYKKHRTFLCDVKGFDFANQFVEQYFTNYDELNRPNIEPFYSQNVMFSLTYRDIPDKHSRFKNYRQMREYKTRNRNLFNGLLARPQFPPGTLFYGKNNVLPQLYSFPLTRHHPHSFYVDLMAYSNTQAIIYVTGVFMDVAGPLICGFTRNFVLSSEDGKEWVIINEQLFVYAPYKYKDILGAWPAPKTEINLFPDPNFNPEHMDALTLTFESITGMAYEYSEQFLAKNSWCLELALKVFIDEYTNDEISEKAFNDQSLRTEDHKEESDDEAVIITEDDILPPIENLLKSKTPLRLASTDTNQNLNETRVVSSQNEKSVQNQVASPTRKQLGPSVTRSCHSIPYQLITPTSSPLSPSSSQIPSTDPLPMLEGPELHSTSSLPLTNEEELAEMVLLQPNPAEWSPELRLRLAKLRRPREVPGPWKCRYRLKTRFGQTIRVNLPQLDILPPIENLVVRSKTPPRLVSTGTNQNQNEITVVSSQNEKPVQNQEASPTWERLEPSINHRKHSVPYQLTTTSSTLLSPSFPSQIPSTDPLPMLEGPELHSTSPLPLTNEEELAEMVLLQPNPSDWSPELRLRLAKMRPPGTKNRRIRRRLRARSGQSVRVRLPSPDTTYENLSETTVVPSRNEKPDQKQVTSPTREPLGPNTLPPLDNLVVKSKTPPPLGSTGPNQNQNETTVVSSQDEKPVQNEEASPMGERVGPNIDHREHSVPYQLTTTSSTLLSPSFPSQIPSTDPLPMMLEGPELHSTSPLPLTNEEELAEMVLLQPNPSDWSPELRLRLAKLRPPQSRKRRIRRRLVARSGQSIRVRLPSTDTYQNLTTVVPSRNEKPDQNQVTSPTWEPLGPKTLPPLENLVVKSKTPHPLGSTGPNQNQNETMVVSSQDEKPVRNQEASLMGERVGPSIDHSNHSVPHQLTTPTSTPPSPSSSQIPSTDSLPILEGPEDLRPLTNEEELAEMALREPNQSKWSNEMLLRLEKLRPPGKIRKKRIRRRLTARSGQTVRVRIPTL